MTRLNTTDRGLLDVLIEAHRHGFTVKNDFARRSADYVAMAASLGLLSTRVFGDVFSSEWRPTTKGMAFLAEMGEHATDQFEDHQE